MRLSRLCSQPALDSKSLPDERASLGLLRDDVRSVATGGGMGESGTHHNARVDRVVLDECTCHLFDRGPMALDERNCSAGG